MSLVNNIKRDLERPQVKLMSMPVWSAKSGEPSPGWVKVIGPCVPVQCPTLATDLNGEDYIARHAEVRRIARVPEMEARILADAERLKAADELIEVILDLQEALSEARQGQTVNMGAHEISAYRALQGGDA